MTPLQAFFLGCMVSLIPSVLLMAFLFWRENSARLLIESQPDILIEDQLAAELRARVDHILHDDLKSETEIDARLRLVNSARAVLIAVGFNVLNTGSVAPRAPIEGNEG